MVGFEVLEGQRGKISTIMATSSRSSTPVTPSRGRGRPARSYQQYHQHRCTDQCVAAPVSGDQIRLLLRHSKQEILEGIEIPPELDMHEDVPEWPDPSQRMRAVCDHAASRRKPTIEMLLARDELVTKHQAILCPQCGIRVNLHIGRKPGLGGAWILNVSLFFLDVVYLC